MLPEMLLTARLVAMGRIFRAIVLLPMMTLICLNSVAVADEVAVTMAGGKFTPAIIKLKVGDAIRFVNDDTAAHNVFVPTKGFSVDLGIQQAGKTTMLLVAKAGKFEVECVIHQGMSMKVEVGQ